MRFSEDRIEKLRCSDGIQRDNHIWEPDHPRAVFLTLHGGMDHGGNYLFPGLYFKDHRIATLALDQHGHDHQEKVYIPRFEVFLEDMTLMIQWIKANFTGLPIIILSHSLGGLIATHFGIRSQEEDPLIRGYILSSPYYVNAIKVAGIVKKVAGILSFLVPEMTVPIEDPVSHLTRDREVYERHRVDIGDHIKAHKPSARFAYELLKAQRWVPGHISEWKQPVLAIVAGNDRLADAHATLQLLGQIKPGLVTTLFYRDNYHENFNELNRDEIFGEIVKWVEPRIKKV